MRLALAAALLLPALLAGCAAPGPGSPFSCRASGTESPVPDPEATARFNALAAPGTDGAAMTALAGDWRLVPPPFDNVIDGMVHEIPISDQSMTLSADGRLAFRARTCAITGCEDERSDGRWAAVAEGGATRLLLQAGSGPQGGRCTELVTDPAAPGQLASPGSGAIWVRA